MEDTLKHHLCPILGWFAYKKFLKLEFMGQRESNLQRPLTFPAKAPPPAPLEQDQTSGPGVQGPRTPRPH